jgi:CRP-like cAMP-binding protein
MPYKIREFGKGEIVARTDDRPQSCCVILTGFLCRQKVVAARNQITSIYIAGDMPDLHTLHLPRMDRELCSIGTSTVAFVPHAYLRHALAGSAGLTNAFWRETLVQAEIHREWVDRLGSRHAVSRVAHFICEVLARLESVGLGEDQIFNAPFTQRIVADARAFTCSFKSIDPGIATPRPDRVARKNHANPTAGRPRSTCRILSRIPASLEFAKSSTPIS